LGDRDSLNLFCNTITLLCASMFDDYTMEWLHRRGYLNWGKRGRGEAIIAADLVKSAPRLGPPKNNSQSSANARG
jgi:hypothetical protein